MKNWWVSFYINEQESIWEIHSPWCFTSIPDMYGFVTICAAVKAATPEEAKQYIQGCIEKGDIDRWRFVEPRPDNWSPFSDRFRKRDWMVW